ncbi:hypothetical protein AUG19_06980 [archaeon 13_1_20CM_2_54_9]|nr:MAG: hypothetical protein AUG19_06980 [archaeon 13_1_20CM_2_54_9]
MQSQKPSRPLGVTIIAILALLAGIPVTILGLGLIALSALFAGFLGPTGGVLAGLGAIFGGIILVLGLIWVATGFGFLNGKGWAWALGMVANILLIVFAITLTASGSYGSIAGIIIPGLLVYYLTRTRVKAFFGKASWSPTATFTPPPSFSTPSFNTPSLGTTTSTSFGSKISPTGTSTPAPTLAHFCTHCGATISPGSTKCAACGANL